MKSKKILVLIIIGLIVVLFENMVIKSKTFSKIENEKEIVAEINNTDDEEKEDTEVIILENNIEEQEIVEETQTEADISKVNNTNIQEDPKKNSIVTQEKKEENTKTIEESKTTPVIASTKAVEKETTTVLETKVPEQPKEEMKRDIKQSEKTKCSDTKHGVGVGNSNKWFNSKQDAINYYQGIIKTWGDKWEKFEINDETYQKNCPYGYETWSCPFCEKWTINFYYN